MEDLSRVGALVLSDGKVFNPKTWTSEIQKAGPHLYDHVVPLVRIVSCAFLPLAASLRALSERL